MKVRDWRSPEHGFALDDELVDPSFIDEDPWYPLPDEAVAQRVLHDPAACHAEWVAEDARRERNDQLLAELWASLSDRPPGGAPGDGAPAAVPVAGPRRG